jgi:hypothetical protein
MVRKGSSVRVRQRALENRSDSATEPRIFAALPSSTRSTAMAATCKARVWQRWDDRRAERDLVIKMNTGGGLLTVRPGRRADLEIA